ncbi:MAG: hypothetical protein JNG86_06155, partial [Verrucomicrobiaceae bacterium]|nr:hypothetical protein [Verrucomicrobiaceae bacterium]
MPRPLPRALLAALSLAISQIAAADEPRIVGTAQIGDKFLAYLLPPGSTVPVQLIEGENASPDTWRILEIHRGPQNEPLRLHIQCGSQRQWLAVSGGTAPAPGVEVRRAEATADTAPLIDVPVSPHGPLHDQMLHRSRIKAKPAARAADRLSSDLDP